MIILLSFLVPLFMPHKLKKIKKIAAGDQKGGGFIDFYFTKPGESEAKAKRGFIQKFEPYGWYIGTGNYQKDMTPLI